MATFITVAFVLAVVFLCWVIMKALWNSKLFWFAALALTIVLFPVTAGLSPFALFVIVLVRLMLVSRAINAGGSQ